MPYYMGDAFERSFRHPNMPDIFSDVPVSLRPSREGGGPSFESGFSPLEGEEASAGPPEDDFVDEEELIDEEEQDDATTDF